jgi:hypothetical protein
MGTRTGCSLTGSASSVPQPRSRGRAPQAARKRYGDRRDIDANVQTRVAVYVQMQCVCVCACAQAREVHVVVVDVREDHREEHRVPHLNGAIYSNDATYTAPIYSNVHGT